MNGTHRAVTHRIQTYLGQVSSILRREDLGSEDIDSICDGLKEQILDMAGQSGPVDEESIVQAIASMEEPASFAESVRSHASDDRENQSARNEVSKTLASIGFYLAIGGPVMAMMLGMIKGVLGGGGMEFGSFILFAVAIAATILGTIARQEVRGRAAIKVAIGTIIGYFLLVAVALLVG